MNNAASPPPRSIERRLDNLDFSRCLAVFSVCMCHASEATMHAGFLPFSVLHTIGRMGVPLFLMISGALVLSKQFDSYSDIKRFYLKNLVPLVITSELWILLYWVYFQLSHSLPQDQMTLVNLLQWMTFMDRFPLGHWWYMPMIIGLYVCVPFVSIVLKSVDIKSLHLVILLIILYWSIRPVCIQYLSYFNIAIPIVSTGNIQLNTSLWGGIYSLYLVVGFTIQEGRFKTIPVKALVLLGLLSMIGCVSLGMLKRDLWYDNIFLLVLTACTFELLRRITYPGRIKRYMRSLSKGSFGIYVLHMPLVSYLTALVSPIESGTIRALLITTLLLLICHAAVSLISRNRQIGTMLFHYK